MERRATKKVFLVSQLVAARTVKQCQEKLKKNAERQPSDCQAATEASRTTTVGAERTEKMFVEEKSSLALCSANSGKLYHALSPHVVFYWRILFDSLFSVFLP